MNTTTAAPGEEGLSAARAFLIFAFTAMCVVMLGFFMGRAFTGKARGDPPPYELAVGAPPPYEGGQQHRVVAL